jgi:hypothetical protein
VFDSLSDILLDRVWWRREAPFPHVVASCVFVPEVAHALAAAMRSLIDDAATLRHFGWYDAYGWGFPYDTPWPFSIFTSPDWHTLIATAMGVSATTHVAGGAHHHPRGTGSGFVHNDLNPVYFDDSDQHSGQIRLPAHDRVSYTQGTVLKPGAKPREVVRRTALLYYLANPRWAPGDGGETGLYKRRTDKVGHARLIPPINNSMLIFNCTPRSFHGFIANPRHERNSIVMWLHDDAATMTDQFGADNLARFVKGR